jgi:hypothetical protein
MEKNDGGGIGPWPVLLLILGVIGGASATQVSRRPTGPPRPTATGFAQPGTATTASGAAALITGLLGVGPAPAQGPDAVSESLDALLERARTMAAGRHISIEFLVATLPDYVDSNSGWNFDPSLDAVQRAAGVAGYALDRFYLPDWTPTSADEAAPASGRRHEVEPGLVLFRHVDERTADTKILAVFIVAETPTSGIHEQAFLTAAGIVAAWHAEDGYALRVLGPTFSGSAPSLRRAIQTFLDVAPRRPATVRVLSGTATRRANQGLLTFQWPEKDDVRSARVPAPVQVSFAATVRADDVMLHTLHDHLAEINEQWRDGAGIVLLVESNTGYGQGFAGGQDAEGNAGADEGGGAGSDPFPRALRIPFPIHISRLRAEAERARSAEPRPAGTVSGTMLRDIGPATDQLPSMTPQITAGVLDTLVESILATIRREEYQAIGIFSTDKRDHLFLAERIVREVPNALLFTTEADLIYVHPEFRSFVRGAIVASSYPLFNATQSLTSPHLASLGRQQFSTMGAQGMYNAVLKLLERDDLMLDYLPPGCLAPARGDRSRLVLSASAQCLAPPVWISVAGRDGLWPVDSHLDDEAASALEGATPYTVSPDRERLSRVVQALNDGRRTSDPTPGAYHAGESTAAHALLHVATWMKATFVVLLLALFVHLIAYLDEASPIARRAHAWWISGSRWHAVERLRARMVPLVRGAKSLPGARLLHAGAIDEPHAAREHRLFLFIAFAVLWFASVWSMRLLRIWLDDSTIQIAAGVSQAAPSRGPIVWYLLYGGMLALLVAEVVLSIFRRRAVAPKGWVPGAIVSVVALFLAFRAGLSLTGFIGSQSWSDPESARLLFARTVNPGNWVSPAAPVLALLAVIYLWTLWNIRQLLTGGSTYRRSSELFQLLTGREADLTDEVADVLVSPWRRQDWRCLAIPFGLLIAFVLYVPTWYTPDGHGFDGFLWWGSLLMVFLIAHSLSMTVHLWLLVRRMLQHLFSHQIAAAFARVADEPFNWQLSLTPPRAIELKPMARKARTLRLELGRIIRELPGVEASAALSPSGERRRLNPGLPVPVAMATTGGDPADLVGTAARALEVRFQDVVPIAATIGVELPDTLDQETTAGRQPYFKSQVWSTLVTLSDGLVPVLRHGFWHRGNATAKPGLDGWYRNAEALVGMQVAFVLRDLLARLVSGMTFTIIGAVIALASHLFYSFPGRSAMLAFDWILLAMAVASAAVMLIRLEKDPSLSLLWSRTPGRLIWTGGFVYRLALYGVIPIVTLFVWQFPEVGGTLFAWMEPLQRAIP